MDELVKQITERTGLPPEMAKAAAEAVLQFLKARLPESIGSHLDSVIAGGASAEVGGGLLGSATETLGSFFGKDK